MQEIKASQGTVGKVFGAILILLSILFLVFALLQEPTNEECVQQVQGTEVISEQPIIKDDKFNF